MVRDLIQDRFNVTYHRNYVPELLHRLGLSVQRPRKRLARADLKAQAHWVAVDFPAIKKKPKRAGASSSSRTKPASGSTGRSTRRGHPSANSPGSPPLDCERPPTSLAPLP